MARVEIEVNGRPYKVTCEDGQERRLTELARYLDRHIAELAETLGQIGEARILLLAALTVCDELFETRGRLAAAEERARGVADPSAAADRIDDARARIEQLAEKLKDAG
ncbi:MAG: cell division protein ZapA [Alphaproteobacteria bacterium]|nr:cell division protein ZapA [Alphaproteobacteria bacterium]